MRKHITVTAVRQKDHEHKLRLKDRFCRECGENVMETGEYEADACSECGKALSPATKFCPRCGESATDLAEPKFVFLGVPLAEQDYRKARASMAGKAHTIRRDGMKWRIDFNGPQGAKG